MSYILNRGTKGRPPRRSKPLTSSTMIRSSKPSFSRPGGGQVQIQKPPEQDQALKQRVKETMSMEKVMADLRILEEQQAESERKLQYAQELKQRRLEALKTCEHKLHDLQYKNGQMRACIDRHRDTLAINQRRVLEMKQHANERGDELGSFSEEVNMLHEAMQSLVRGCRQHQGFIDTYETKLGMLRNMVDESYAQVQQLEHELQAIHDRQDTLHAMIRQETLAEQQLMQEISDLRQEILELEQDLTDATNEQTKQNNILESVNAELAKAKDQYQTAEESHKTAIAQTEEEIASLTAKKKTVGCSVDQAKKELHASWSEIVEMQTAEGHTPSLLPSQTDDPPTIDLNMIQDSLQKEKSAVEEEKLAETQLRDCVASLADRLKQCNIEFEEATVELEAKKASVVTKLAEEETRKKAKDKLIEEVRNYEKTLEDMVSAMKPLQQMADEDRLARQKELDEIEAEESKLQSELDEVLAERVKIKERVATAAERQAAELAVLEDSIAKERERTEDLDATIHNLEKLCRHNFSLEDIAERKKDATTAQREIDRCIEKYPQLEHLVITYRKDLSSSEQIDIDLADLKASVSAKAEELKKLREASKTKSRATEDPPLSRKPTTGKDTSGDPSDSVAKPRSLLQKFVQASQTEDSEDEDHIPFDDQSKCTIDSQGEKRVRWRQDAGTVGSDDVTEKVNNLKVGSSQSELVPSRRKSFARETLAWSGDVGKSKTSRPSDGKNKLSSEGIFSDPIQNVDGSDDLPYADQRKKGRSKERNQKKTKDGRMSTKKPVLESKVAEKRLPFAETAPKRNENLTSAKRPHAGTSKNSVQQKAPQSSALKHTSVRQDRKISKADTTDHAQHRKRSGSVKILKRPRGNDDSSVATKSTKRSFKPQATVKDRDNAVSQTTQESKKRRRRPKSKNSSWSKNGLPEISFA